MRKKYTPILIVLVIASAIITIIVVWMKLTHREYAGDALTTSLILYIITGLSVIIWFLFNYRNKETKF
jgi:uncharacterized membrane protein YjjP (DUF1212 family)